MLGHHSAPPRSWRAEEHRSTAVACHVELRPSRGALSASLACSAAAWDGAPACALPRASSSVPQLQQQRRRRGDRRSGMVAVAASGGETDTSASVLSPSSNSSSSTTTTATMIQQQLEQQQAQGEVVEGMPECAQEKFWHWTLPSGLQARQVTHVRPQPPAAPSTSPASSTLAHSSAPYTATHQHHCSQRHCLNNTPVRSFCVYLTLPNALVTHPPRTQVFSSLPTSSLSTTTGFAISRPATRAPACCCSTVLEWAHTTGSATSRSFRRAAVCLRWTCWDRVSMKGSVRGMGVDERAYSCCKAAVCLRWTCWGRVSTALGH